MHNVSNIDTWKRNDRRKSNALISSYMSYPVHRRAAVDIVKKGKVFPYSLPNVGPELIPVYRQSARMWREVNHTIDLSVVCHCFLPGLRLPA